MSGPARGRGSVPPVTESLLRYRRWIARAYGFAAVCLGALAVLEAARAATPLLRTLLMVGIAAAGTAAWVMQARRKCPNCGKPYGYHLRIVNANRCRHCGAEFPQWRPGMDEAGDGEQN